MRVNEVRKTETIEKLVRTEYIAEDGTVFRSEEECKKYEESALFAISKELKRLDDKKNGADLECLPMWHIQFENGDKIAAYPEEICLYERKDG